MFAPSPSHVIQRIPNHFVTTNNFNVFIFQHVALSCGLNESSGLNYNVQAT